MFLRIARFEFGYQVKSPVFWVASAIFLLIAFGSIAIPQVQIGSAGNTHVNAPFAIVEILETITIFAMFLMTAFVANVVVRDDETGFGPIIRSTPISKFDYLFGRFTGAYLAGLLAFASVPLGILLGTFMPWMDPVKLGPLHLAYYLYAFLFAAPTLFVMAAGFFALATATRSMLAAYIGVVGFLILYFSLTALFSRPQYDSIVGPLEPFGIGALDVATKYWTASDRNTMLPPISGIVLENRLIWLSIAFVFLAVAYGAYRFRSLSAKRPSRTQPEETSSATPAGPLPSPRYDRRTVRAQFWKWTRFEMGQVFRSPAFLVLLALGVVFSMGTLWPLDDVGGITIFPVTRVMIEALERSFIVIPFIVAIYYAGELVWRERDKRTDVVIDACPVPDWIFVVPKIAAISFVLFATCLVSVAVSVAVQTLKGYHNYELGHYLLWYVEPATVWAIKLAIFAVFVQALVPHKYWGWGLVGLYLVGRAVLSITGYSHPLFLFDFGPIPLSDMNGEGAFWIKRAWIDVYWGAIMLMLAVLAYCLWRRGTETRLRPRFARLPRRLSGLAGALVAVALVVAIGSGAFIYYNMNILNEYRTSVADDRYDADYEKTLLPFQSVPQPRVTDVALNVAIYPHDHYAETRGRYTIENRTGAVLSQIHLRWIRDLEMRSLKVEGAHLIKDYGRFHYVIYAFDKPLMPGEQRHVLFDTVYGEKGFRSGEDLTRVVDNGTFVNNFEIGPVVGMSRQGALLTDPSKRRRYGLPAELRPPKLEDDSARAVNYLAPWGDWVNSDITVSTVADQTPIAPGYKVLDIVRDGRRIARFKSDARILPFFSIQSARYAIRQAKWKDIDLAVYYDAHHPFNVDRMLTAMKTSFEVYEKAFGPYQFHQLRVLEFPAYADFAQSFANTVPYSESLGFIQDSAAVDRDPDKIDWVTYATAHEIGHQWWAHQIIGADMQGDTMLSESFAQYSAMLVMERLYGPDRVRKFLKYALDQYLRSRGRETIEELPLVRVENQAYIHYQKGALVMYRLKETVGEDVVDRALRRLLAQYAFRPAPYPSSKDFVHYLREEAGPKYDALITDLFERITLYDLKALSATAEKRADGKFDVALTVEAHKFYADGKGKETEVPMREDVPIGAFLVAPDKKDFGSAKVLSLKNTPVHSGKQTLHLILEQKPAAAGIDPYNEWIDRNSNDNVVQVANRSS